MVRSGLAMRVAGDSVEFPTCEIGRGPQAAPDEVEADTSGRSVEGWSASPIGVETLAKVSPSQRFKIPA